MEQLQSLRSQTSKVRFFPFVFGFVLFSQRYVTLLDELVAPFGASFVAMLQPQFPDMNLTAFFPPPAPVPPGLDDFSAVGLVDPALVPKPALKSWDAIFNKQQKLKA
jgi:hypothetical protein